MAAISVFLDSVTNLFFGPKYFLIFSVLFFKSKNTSGTMEIFLSKFLRSLLNKLDCFSSSVRIISPGSIL